jgi:hypothetical protein
MKNYIFSLLGILLIQSFSFAQSSWKSTEYKPEKYRKVLVLAKTTDDLAKRQIEDATVKFLGEQGIVAIVAYSNIVDADLVSEDAFLSKADALEIDALLVYKVIATNTEYKNGPALNASVGIPVRVGIFGGFLGTNVPLAGGAKTVNTVKVTASFYNKASKAMQWSFPLSAKLKKSTDKIAVDFAKITTNAMLKDKLFVL